MASANEAELGGFFLNYQKATSIWTAIEEIFHPQQPTSAATENTSENIIVNGTAKKIQSNRHEILLGARQNTTKPFLHILGGRKEKPGRLLNQTPPDLATQNYSNKVFEMTRKIQRKPKITEKWNQTRVFRKYQSQSNLDNG